MLVLDESHEAGGTENRRIDKETGEPIKTRADYFREVLQASAGAVYSSATYAKNPTVMSLYNRTDLRYAVEDMSKLGEAITKGGVPMQQVVANMLVESGQYARRERSFKGVEMVAETMGTDAKVAERVNDATAEIFNLDRDYMVQIREEFLEKLKRDGMLAGKDISLGDSGSQQVGFANVMHNVVNQALFALKADAVADKAIALHKAGKKPLIAVSNTNETILREYAQAEGISEGEAVNLTFNDILDRYLTRITRVTVRDSNDVKHHFYMKPSDIAELGGPDALKAFNAARERLKKADFAGIPAMPIDHLQDRLRAAGLRVGEITGRGLVVEHGILASREAERWRQKENDERL